MSSTLRPSRPPFLLTSSTHICSASSAALPPPPSVPVCAMPMPIFTGCCASAAPASTKVSSTAPSARAMMRNKPLVIVNMTPPGTGCGTVGRLCEGIAICQARLSLSAEMFLGIDEEDWRHVRAPQIERVLGRPVGAFPAVTRRDVIDVGGILAERAPRVLDVVEIVRAEDVAAGAPAVLVAFIRHLRGAAPHVFQARHVPRAMVPALG